MSSTSTMDAWVLGNLTIDDLVMADGTTRMGLCGGNAIFAALGARMWSESVGLAARMGPDFPRDHVRALEALELRLALSEVAAPTIHSWALYESPERRRFINWLDSGSHAEQSLRSSELPRDVNTTRVCHVAPMPLEIQTELVDYLAAQPPLISLDPHDEYIAGAEHRYLEMLRGVDIFLPSQQEAALLYGLDDPERSASAFAAAGARVVVVKLGTEGSLVLGPGLPQPVHIPSVPVQVVDPTGAGDAYCGAFCVTYAQTGDAITSAVHATVAASFVVECAGALAVLPFDRTLILQRLARLSSTIQPLRTEMQHACAWRTAS